MATTVYRGSGWGKTQVGVCDSGRIYAESGFYRETKGNYRNGEVFISGTWSDRRIGYYQNGDVYDENKRKIGSYSSDGRIYEDGGGWFSSKTQIGEASGGEIGAAAAALLLIFR